MEPDPCGSSSASSSQARSEGRRLIDAYRLMPEAIAFVAGVDESDVQVELVDKA